MSTLKTNNVQVGQSVTATNNFTIYQPSTPDGTVRIGVGNSGATTADVLTANSSGNVGIGTIAPAYPLQVSTAAETNIAITGGTTSETNIFFGDSGSATIGRITYNNNGDYMRFNTNGSERARIDSSGNFSFNSGYGSVATAYACRAWVNFNGTGTVAIRASGNVSSITDNSTGDYTVNFTTAMPDVNYAANITAEPESANPTHVRMTAVYYNSRATSSVRVRVGGNATEQGPDAFGMFVTIFR